MVNKKIEDQTLIAYTGRLSREQEMDLIEREFLGRLIDKIRYRKTGEKASSGKKNCIPFSNRTFVRATGEVQFCERIQDNSVQRKGISKEGLVDSSVKLVDEFERFKKDECSKCFAYNFCELCPASFMSDGQLNRDIATEKCSQFRANIKSAIEIYINE